MLRLQQVSHWLNVRTHNLLQLSFLHVRQLILDLCVKLVEETDYEISVKLRYSIICIMRKFLA